MRRPNQFALCTGHKHEHFTLKGQFDLCFSAMNLDRFEKGPREILHPEIQKVRYAKLFSWLGQPNKFGYPVRILWRKSLKAHFLLSHCCLSQGRFMRAGGSKALASSLLSPPAAASSAVASWQLPSAQSCRNVLQRLSPLSQAMPSH